MQIVTKFQLWIIDLSVQPAPRAVSPAWLHLGSAKGWLSTAAAAGLSSRQQWQKNHTVQRNRTLHETLQ